MADKNKRSKFLGIIKYKKKTSVDVYKKYAPAVLKAVNELPNGSVQKDELKTRLSVIFNEAKSDINPKKALKQVARDAAAAVKALAEQPVESTISGPIQDDTAEDMRRKVDDMYKIGEGAKLFQMHLDGVNPELERLKGALVNLKNEVKKRDAGLTDVVIGQDALVDSLVSDVRRKLNSDLKDTANDLDVKAKKGEIPPEDVASGLVTLKQHLDAHLDKVKDDVADLVSQIENIASQPNTLRDLAAEALKNQNADKLLQEYYDKVAEVDAAISKIEDWGVAGADDLRATFIKKSGDNPDDPATAKDDLDALLGEAKTAAKSQTEDYNKDADKLKQRLDAVTSKITELVISIQLQANSEWEKSFRKQVDTEIEVITTMIGNGANKTALAGAEQMVASLEQRAFDLEDNLKAMIDLGEVQFQCSKALGDKRNKKMCPDLCEALQTEYDDAKKASLKKAASLAITDFQTLLDKIKTGPTSLVSLAAEREAWLKRFKTSSEKAEKALGVLLKAMKSVVPKDSPDFFKAYVGPLADDLAQAREYAGNESKISMAAADEALRKIIAQIVNTSEALKKSADQRTEEENQLCLDAMAGQNKGLEDLKKKKEDALEFRRKYDEFMEKHEDLYFRYGFGTHFRNEFLSIEDMAKSAKNVMKTTEDLERSVKVLEAADNKLGRVVNEAKLGRTKLAGICSTWNIALNKLDAGIANIQVEALKKVAGHEDLEAAAEKIEDTLKNATRYIDEHLFDEAEKVYANKDATGAELRRTREDTLNKIRLTKEFIANDPLIRSAQANPFGVKNVISPVFATLRDLEYKVLISA